MTGLKLPRATQIGLGLLVLVMAALSMIASTSYVPDPGIDGGDVGGMVTGVIPGSPAWRDEIRSGDRILELQQSDSAGGWEIVAVGSDGVVRRSGTTDHVGVIRSQIPWSALALAISAFAAFAAYRGHRAAAAILPIALFLAAEPLLVAGALVIEVPVGAIVFVGASIAAIAFTRPRRAYVLLVLVGFVLAGLWVVAILASPDTFDAIDTARPVGAAAFSIIGIAVVLDRRRVSEFMTGPSSPQFVDIAYLGLALGVLVAGVARIVPLGFAVVVTLVAVAAYPLWRRMTISAFETFVTSRARREASIRAVEDERRRLARDIHDTPLQELSGVIRRLEATPGAEREADALRTVAGHLRDVATILHPPVLQDLGLAAAIEDLRDQLCEGTPVWRITVAVDDLTGSSRPPADIELAAFRVTQEALANALTHSGGRCADVSGSVAAHAIELSISDDGHGILEDDARVARRAGHFGVDSMRERADAVGAAAKVTSTHQGVRVEFRWEARS